VIGIHRWETRMDHLCILKRYFLLIQGLPKFYG
jgi:hypothetical protein